MNTQIFKQLFARAQSQRLTHEAELSQLFEYTFPEQNSFNRTNQFSANRSRLFDSTAGAQVEDLSANIGRLLLPAGTKWVSIEYKEHAIDPLNFDEKEVLENVNRILHETFSQSMFYLAAHEAIQTCVLTGTGCIAIYQDDFGMVEFCSVPIGELYFLNNHRNEIYFVARRFKMSLIDILSTYPNKGNLPQLNDLNHTDQHELTEVVYIDENNKIIYGVFFGNNWEPLLIEKKAFNPFIVFRWSKNSGQCWGDSPFRAALPIIKMLNELDKDILVNSEYQAYGLYQQAPSALNIKNLQSRLKPGSVFTHGGAPLEPLRFSGDLQFAYKLQADLRQELRNITYGNAAVMESGKNSYKTATEVQIQHNQYLTRIGAPALRLQSEFLIPIAQQTINRLQKNGAFVDYDFKFNPEIHKVVVQSAAERAQKFSAAVSESQAFVSAVQTYGPETIQRVVNIDMACKKYFSNIGFDPSCIKSDEDIKAEQEQMEQMKQFQQGAQIAAQAGNAGASLLNAAGEARVQGLLPE